MTLDDEALSAEAECFGLRMHESGLVSPVHASLLRFIGAERPELLADALALNGVILFFSPIPPALHELLVIDVDLSVGAVPQGASPLSDPPDPVVLLLAGTLSVIGQPCGMDQGHNPTCQAGRAIRLWNRNDVGYLPGLIERAAPENDVLMHFEGETLRASELTFGLAEDLHADASELGASLHQRLVAKEHRLPVQTRVVHEDCVDRARPLDRLLDERNRHVHALVPQPLRILHQTIVQTIVQTRESPRDEGDVLLVEVVRSPVGSDEDIAAVEAVGGPDRAQAPAEPSDIASIGVLLGHSSPS